MLSRRTRRRHTEWISGDTMKNNRKKKSKISLLAAFLLITLLALLLSTAGVTLAKYVTERQSAGTAAAKPFYFSSDLLAEESANVTVPYYQLEDTQSETVTISFTLSNYIDALRRTDRDISYTYEVTDSASLPIGETGTGTVSGSAASTETVNIELSSAHLANDGVVTVRVRSTAPYSTTLSARFGFVEDDSAGLHYTVTEEGSAVILTVRGGSGQTLTISWPETLTPDMTNELFENSAGSAVSFTAQANTSYALVFLKSDASLGYSLADFSVTAV